MVCTLVENLYANFLQTISFTDERTHSTSKGVAWPGYINYRLKSEVYTTLQLHRRIITSLH